VDSLTTGVIEDLAASSALYGTAHPKIDPSRSRTGERRVAQPLVSQLPNQVEVVVFQSVVIDSISETKCISIDE
jgi:hypothetical protein